MGVLRVFEGALWLSEINYLMIGRWKLAWGPVLSGTRRIGMYIGRWLMAGTVKIAFPPGQSQASALPRRR